MTTTAQPEGDKWDLLLDSGCHTHVTTLDDDRGPTVAGDVPPLRVATGKPLETNGKIQVDLTVDGKDAAGQQMRMKMIRCNVTRALVSVGQLCEEGYSIAMNKNGGLMVSPTGAKTVLVKKGRFFYLRASTREAPTARPLGRGAVLMADAEMPEAGAEDDAEEEAPPDDDLAPGQADDENEEVEPHVRDNENLLAPEVGERASGSAARLVPQPIVPDHLTQMKHVAGGHLPYAAWCKYCVVGRAKDDAHKRQAPRSSARPVIEMDYMFLTENQETLTVAVVVDKASGSIGATAFSHKGPEKSGVDYIAT